MNPINFDDLINSSDAQAKANVITSAIDDMIKSFTELYTIVDKNSKSIASQMADLAEASKRAGEAMAKNNGKNLSDSEKQTMELLAAMKKLRSEYESLSSQKIELKGSIDGMENLKEATKKANKETKEFAEGSLGDLKKKLKESEDALGTIAQTINGKVNPAYDAQQNKVNEARIAFEKLNNSQKEAAAAARATAKSNDVVVDSLEGMRLQLSNLTKQRKGMSAIGEDFDKITEKILNLNNQIKKIEFAGGDFRRDVGNYKSALSGFKEGFNLESIFGMGGAAGAGAAAGAKAMELLIQGVQYAIQNAKELNEQLTKTATFTETAGQELYNYTGSARAISQTYGQDFDKVVQSANAMSKQFGISQDEAFDNISKGLAKGGDAAGDYLDNVREYSSVFTKIGLTANQFSSVLVEATKAGTFDDKVVDSLKNYKIESQDLTKATNEMAGSFSTDFITKFNKAAQDGSKNTIELMNMQATEAKRVGMSEANLMKITSAFFTGAGEDAGGFLEVVSLVNKGILNENKELTEFQKGQQETYEANKALGIQQAEFAAKIKPLLDGSSTLLTNLTTALYEYMNYFTDGLMEVYSELMNVFNFIKEAVLGVIPPEAIEAFKSFFVDTKGEATGFSQFFIALFENIAIPFKGISTVLVKTVSFFAAVKAAGDEVAKSLGNFFDQLGTDFNTFLDLIGITFIGERIAKIGEGVGKLGDMLSGMVENGIASATKLWDFMAAGLNRFLNFADAATDGIQSSIFDNIIDPLARGFDWVKNQFLGLINSITDSILTTFPIIQKLFPENLGNKAGGILDTFTKKYDETIKKLEVEKKKQEEKKPELSGWAKVLSYLDAQENAALAKWDEKKKKTFQDLLKKDGSNFLDVSNKLKNALKNTTTFATPADIKASGDAKKKADAEYAKSKEGFDKKMLALQKAKDKQEIADLKAQNQKKKAAEKELRLSEREALELFMQEEKEIRKLGSEQEASAKLLKIKFDPKSIEDAVALAKENYEKGLLATQKAYLESIQKMYIDGQIEILEKALANQKSYAEIELTEAQRLFDLKLISQQEYEDRSNKITTASDSAELKTLEDENALLLNDWSASSPENEAKVRANLEKIGKLRNQIFASGVNKKIQILEKGLKSETDLIGLQEEELKAQLLRREITEEQYEKRTFALKAKRIKAEIEALEKQNKIEGLSDEKILENKTKIAKLGNELLQEESDNRKRAADAFVKAFSDITDKLIEWNNKEVDLRISQLEREIDLQDKMLSAEVSLAETTGQRVDLAERENQISEKQNAIFENEARKLRFEQALTLLKSVAAFITEGDNPLIALTKGQGLLSIIKSFVGAFHDGGRIGGGEWDEHLAIVHGGEQVMPKWQVDENPKLVQAIEMNRTIGKPIGEYMKDAEVYSKPFQSFSIDYSILAKEIGKEVGKEIIDNMPISYQTLDKDLNLISITKQNNKTLKTIIKSERPIWS